MRGTEPPVRATARCLMGQAGARAAVVGGVGLGLGLGVGADRQRLRARMAAWPKPGPASERSRLGWREAPWARIPAKSRERMGSRRPPHRGAGHRAIRAACQAGRPDQAGGPVPIQGPGQAEGYDQAENRDLAEVPVPGEGQEKAGVPDPAESQDPTEGPVPAGPLSSLGVGPGAPPGHSWAPPAGTANRVGHRDWRIPRADREPGPSRWRAAAQGPG